MEKKTNSEQQPRRCDRDEGSPPTWSTAIRSPSSFQLGAPAWPLIILNFIQTLTPWRTPPPIGRLLSAELPVWWPCVFMDSREVKGDVCTDYTFKCSTTSQNRQTRCILICRRTVNSLYSLFEILSNYVFYNSLVSHTSTSTTIPMSLSHCCYEEEMWRRAAVNSKHFIIENDYRLYTKMDNTFPKVKQNHLKHPLVAGCS